MRITGFSVSVGPIAGCDCVTEVELLHRLRRSHRQSCAVLYLVIQGLKGKIVSEREFIGLERLGAIMGSRYRDWAVHFGSCLTLRDGERLRKFKRAIGARVVSGYSIYSNWDRDFSALETAWLCQLVTGHRTLPIGPYRRLIKKTGLVVL